MAAITAAIHENTKEGRRDGRGGTRVGTTRRNREGRVHQSILAREECEGVTRGATGGQRRGRNEYRTRGMGRTRGKWTETETERTSGGNVFGGEGSERSPSSLLTTLHVQSGQLCVWRGRRVVVHVMANRLLHSKRRKKEGICNSSLIKIISDQPQGAVALILGLVCNDVNLDQLKQFKQSGRGVVWRAFFCSNHGVVQK